MARFLNGRYFAVLIFCGLTFWIAGCTRPEPPSEIVQRAQAAGAGDLSTASVSSTEDWMRKHMDVAVEIDTMCKPVRVRANAEWGDTTEGKVCLAARNVAMSTYRSPRDGKGYHAADK